MGGKNVHPSKLVIMNIKIKSQKSYPINYSFARGDSTAVL